MRGTSRVCVGCSCFNPGRPSGQETLKPEDEEGKDEEDEEDQEDEEDEEEDDEVAVEENVPEAEKPQKVMLFPVSRYCTHLIHVVCSINKYVHIY